MARKKGRDGRAGPAAVPADGRLSYGTPVTVNGRTVITVTRVRDQSSGKSRSVESTPVGFIEVSDEGSAFVPISSDGAGSSGRAVRAAAAAAVTTVAGVLAGARALRSGRRSQRLLPAGRPRLPR
jgi:hypothetical protein